MGGGRICLPAGAGGRRAPSRSTAANRFQVLFKKETTSGSDTTYIVEEIDRIDFMKLIARAAKISGLQESPGALTFTGKTNIITLASLFAVF